MTFFAILGAAVLTALLLCLILRPRLLLLPVVWIFAAWAWGKSILRLPALVGEYLAASSLEKHAAALHHHAQAAVALWGTNSDFRPAAREIFGRVAAGYGIRPREPEIAGAPRERNPFGAAQASHAAELVTASRGLKAVGENPGVLTGGEEK